MELAEIATRINTHLKRFEADGRINKMDKTYKTHPYYYANAVVAGARVSIMYVSYQGRTTLKKAEAVKYLEWLDAGNVGKHWELD